MGHIANTTSYTIEMDNGNNNSDLAPLLESSSTHEPRHSIEEQEQDNNKTAIINNNNNNNNNNNTNNSFSKTSIPPYSKIQDITNNNNNNSSHSHKQCRICGEGEYEYEEEEEEGEAYSRVIDEETLIRDPLQSIPNQQQSQHQPQLMTRYHSSSSWDEQHSQQQANMEEAVQGNQPHHPHHHYQQDHNTKRYLLKKNPLIRPCKCKGTMMYVHVSCLNRWRTMSPRASSYVACDLCGYEYNIFRPRYAALLTNLHFLRLITAFLVLSSIVASAYCCKLIDVYVLHHLPQPENPSWIELHGPTLFWMDRFYLFGGVLVISMLGIAYLVYLCITQPSHLSQFTSIMDDDEDDSDDDDDDENGHPIIPTSTSPSNYQYHYTSYQHQQGNNNITTTRNNSILCCDQTSCPWYGCYLADCAACSGDAAAGGFLIFIVLMFLMAILFGIMGAVTGVYRMIESFVEQLAGHVKERILDVE